MLEVVHRLLGLGNVDLIVVIAAGHNGIPP
jgi:hypothetical protein